MDDKNTVKMMADHDRFRNAWVQKILNLGKVKPFSKGMMGEMEEAITNAPANESGKFRQFFFH